jgi:hypothetical protein
VGRPCHISGISTNWPTTRMKKTNKNDQSDGGYEKTVVAKGNREAKKSTLSMFPIPESWDDVEQDISI